MKKDIWKLSSLGCLLFLFGCADDVANRYFSSERYPPKAASDVELLFDAPECEYEIIAEFQSRGEDAEDMQRKAAKIGADAVVVKYFGGRYSPREQWADPQRASKSIYTRIVGVAVRYKKKEN